jgi:hypothetical protein
MRPNSHPDEIKDLNANTLSLMLQRHWNSPHTALQSVDVALFSARELNVLGFDEMSHGSAMIKASMQWSWGKTTL